MNLKKIPMKKFSMSYLEFILTLLFTGICAILACKYSYTIIPIYIAVLILGFGINQVITKIKAKKQSKQIIIEPVTNNQNYILQMAVVPTENGNKVVFHQMTENELMKYKEEIHV